MDEQKYKYKKEYQNQITTIYNILLNNYGKQGWWPITPIGGCKGKLPESPLYGLKTKNEKQILEIMIGAILTQNTQWKPNVENSIIKLNNNSLIDINSVETIDNNKLSKIIKSSGYHNQKTKTIKNLANFLKLNPIKKLKEMELKTCRELLLNLNGIGEETADSILLYAFEKPIFVVDAYTRRIFSKLEIIDEKASYQEIQGVFMNNLENNHKIFNEYHALIVKHGKLHYRKKPYGNSDKILFD